MGYILLTRCVTLCVCVWVCLCECVCVCEWVVSRMPHYIVLLKSCHAKLITRGSHLHWYRDILIVQLLQILKWSFSMPSSYCRIREVFCNTIFNFCLFLSNYTSNWAFTLWLICLLICTSDLQITKLYTQKKIFKQCFGTL